MFDNYFPIFFSKRDILSFVQMDRQTWELISFFSPIFSFSYFHEIHALYYTLSIYQYRRDILRRR